MSRSPSTPLVLAGGLLIASLVSAVLFFPDPRPIREIASGGVHLSLYGLTLAAMLTLLVATPQLSGRESGRSNGAGDRRSVDGQAAATAGGRAGGRATAASVSTSRRRVGVS